MAGGFQMKELSRYFPLRLRSAVEGILSRDGIEELRIRVNRPIQVVRGGSDELYSRLITNREDCKELYEAFCQQSVYACEDDARCGFITLPHFGIRVGICGNVLEESGIVRRFSEVTGFCIRIPGERLYCSNALCEATNGLMGGASIIIASPPAVGKTTLLRDMARELSDTYGKKVCIIDERSELAGCVFGEPSYNVGLRTDCLDNCSKKNGIIMALRALSPDIIITDELGEEVDFECVSRAMNSGVSVAASIHAGSLKQIENNAFARKVLSSVRYEAKLERSGSMRKCVLYDAEAKSCRDVKIN